MTFRTTEPLETGLSVLAGMIVTLSLLFMIERLSAMRTDDNNLEQALIIDLTEWQVQPEPSQPPPEQKILKPVIKNIPKPVPQELAEKTLIDKSLPEPDTKARTQAEEPSETDLDDARLPVPVPLFKLTEIPRFLHQEIPQYPEAMRTLGKTGHVVLSVLIDKSGRVRDISVLESDGEAFTQAAIKAIMTSSFIPAKIDGTPVAVKLKLPITFKLL